MDEIVRQCVLSSASDISDDEESNYADEEDVLLSTSSCVHTESRDDESTRSIYQEP